MPFLNTEKKKRRPAKGEKRIIKAREKSQIRTRGEEKLNFFTG